MNYIQGKNREQSILFPQSLDQIISSDNDVRIIDLFVESINITGFKFIVKTSSEGRPAYHPKDLLKLFVYGYIKDDSARMNDRIINKQVTEQTNQQTDILKTNPFAKSNKI